MDSFYNIFDEETLNKSFIFSSTPTALNNNYLIRESTEENPYDYLADYLSNFFYELEFDRPENVTRSYSIPGRFSSFDGDGFNFYFNPMFMKYVSLI